MNLLGIGVLILIAFTIGYKVIGWLFDRVKKPQPTAESAAGDASGSGPRWGHHDEANAGRWYGRAAAGAPTDAQAQAAIKQAREGLARLWAQRANAQAVYSFNVGRFVLMVSPDRHCVIALQGSVAPAAIDKFDEALAGAAAERCTEPLTLVLESPGGDFFTGLWLGHRVRARGMHTVSRYPCASSCASIFLGGVDRVLWGQRATLGFHQASTSEKVDRGSGRSCIQEDSDPLMLELRSYVKHMVP